MAKRKAGDGSAGDAAAGAVVEIRQNPDIDLKESGFALLYDPAVLTDRALADVRGQYRRAEDAWQNAAPRLDPFTGEVVPARPGPPPRPLGRTAEQLAYLRELVAPYVGRHAVACLDVCGDENLGVGLRLTTGPFTPDERRPREVERHRLVVTAGRVCVASSEVLRFPPRDLEPGDAGDPRQSVFLGPCRVEVAVPPGDYGLVVSEFTERRRLPYDLVVQLVPGPGA
jgi:hypothetical protein